MKVITTILFICCLTLYCRRPPEEMASLTAPVAYALARNALEQDRAAGSLNIVAKWQNLRNSSGWPEGSVQFEVQSPQFPGKTATIDYVLNGSHVATAIVRLPDEPSKQVSVNLYESAVIFGQTKSVEQHLEELAARLAANATANDRIAVFDFEGINREKTALGRRIAESLVSHLTERDVTVVERRLLEPVFREMEFQNSGLTAERGQELRARIGSFLGANAIVVGTLKNEKEELLLNGRLVRIETGQVLSAGQVIIPKYLIAERDLRILAQ